MSGSICFSSAAILRCTNLTVLENVALVIPTALEVLCSTALIFKHNCSGRKYLLLTAEGWTYFLLSVVQMISGIVPGVRDDVNIFRAFDTAIGVSSFLPLFFYTFFFFLFTSNDLLETLPRGVANIAKYSLILFIPAIVVFNEIGSFTGVEIHTMALQKGQNAPLFSVLFFSSKSASTLWAFFTSLTLALMTAFQAAVFSFAFFRLVRAVLNQRRIEDRGADKAHFFNGIIWICAGIKLGALESLVGLFARGFGLALARRIMRTLSRACLAVGIAKGLDVMEDFRMIQRELRKSNEKNRGQRRSRLREFISHPRISTFRTLSPTATSFHASTRAAQPSIMEKDESTIGQRPHYITYSQRQSYLAAAKGGLPGMKDFALLREERQNRRVTVLRSAESAPRLHMRFSTLEVPAPTLLASDIKIRPHSEVLDRPITSILSLDLPIQDPPDSAKLDTLDVPQPHFRGYDNRDSFNSSVGSPYEIVDARKLTQIVAVGQLYRPQAMRTPDSAGYGQDSVATPLSSQPSVKDPPGLQPGPGIDESRTKSLISNKTNSISAAVRDLADKFPGPPDLSRTRPVVDNSRAFLLRRPQMPPVPAVEERSVWEEDSRTSMAAGLSPHPGGSPYNLSHDGAQTSHLDVGQSLNADNRSERLAYLSGSGSSSPLAFAPPTPQAVKGGKALVTKPDYRISSSSRRSKKSSVKENTPSLADDEFEPTKTPVSAPVGVPLRKSMKLSVAATPMPVVRQSQGGRSPATPTTGLSILSRIQESVAPNQADPFATALDTGKSRDFRDQVPPMPQPTSATGSRIPGRFKSEEKYNMVAEWVDRSASLNQMHFNPEAPPTIEELSARPPIVPSPREKSLQNLHDRGKSIDALTIPWVKTPELAEATRSAAAKAGQASGQTTATYEATMRMKGPRIKTVGKVPSRSTPKPTRIAQTRASLYLQPIVIPPPSRNMPEIDSSPTDSDDRNVLKDSEVLLIENSSRPARF